MRTSGGEGMIDQDRRYSHAGRFAAAADAADPVRQEQERGGISKGLTWCFAPLAALLASEQQRWFLWLPVAFGLGLIIYFRLPAEPSLFAASAPLVAGIALLWFCRRGILSVLLIYALVAAAAGLATAKFRTELLRAPVLNKQMHGAIVRGWIEYVEPRADGGQRLTIQVVDLASMPAARRPVRVRVTTRQADKSLRPGDAIALRATLGPPGIPVLPGGYDFARYAWFKQLGAIGYTRAPAQRIASLGTPPLSLRAAAAIQKIRQTIGRRVDAVLPGETGAIAKALITGERGGISNATNDVFRDSGLFHILSISGLHMAIMAGAIFFLIRLVLATSPTIALRQPIKKWAALAAALGALAYLTISGGTFATVRSYVMISIMFLAVLLDRPALALRNVALAALVILFLFPESILDVGFQMSFAAVVALVAAYEALRDRRLRLRAMGRGGSHEGGYLANVTLLLGGIILTTLIASAAVAPFTAYHFHKSQQYAVLANLIAVPICNMIVMPAALATFIAMPFGLEAGPLWVMGKGVEGMIWCARTVAALPGAVGLLPQIPSLAFSLMVAGGLWLSLWRLRWRLLGLIPILAGLLQAPWQAPPDLLVGDNARLVAIRTGGRLSALPLRSSRYQLSRWLAADGDNRDAKLAMTGAGFRCDNIGCSARVKGRLIAVPLHISALRYDCRKADIVVTTLSLPNGCRDYARSNAAVSSTALNAGDVVVIDRRAVRRKGAHALRITNGQINLDVVAAHRGWRPWSVPHGR